MTLLRTFYKLLHFCTARPEPACLMNQRMMTKKKRGQSMMNNPGYRAPMAPRRLALLAFFALTAGLAGPLWAATGNVSNLDLTAAQGELITQDYPSAQGFTTGNDSAGYALQSVTLPLAAQVSGGITVALHSVSGGNPGTSSLATLTGSAPNTTTMEEYVYTCSSGCQLSNGTSYFIMLTPNNRYVQLRWGQNTSGTQTNTPNDAGWSIADDAKYRDGQGSIIWVNEGAVKLMKVSWATPALTASSVEATTATLGIANYSGTWYYKRTSPSAGQCTSAGSGATASLSGLDSGASYTFKAYSDSSCANELDSADLLTKPGKVAGVSATAGNTSLAVSWTATTGAASYKIQWKSGTDDWDATNRQATSTTASKTLSSLTNDTAYTIRVAAVNTTGDGAWSDEATGTPSAVTLTASNVTSGGATLTLAGHTAAWYYKYTAPSGGDCSSAVSAGTATATLTDLRGSTGYTFNAYGDSSCSTLLATAPAFTTSAPTAPSAPTGLTIRGNSLSCLDGNQNVTSFDFTLDWTAANANGAPVTSHRVFWRKKGTTDWTLKTTLRRPGATIGIAVDTNNLGGSYEVGVRARNSRGWGPQSAYVDFNLSTPPAAPAKPAVEASDRSATLSWRAPSGCGSAVTGYEYVKKTGAGAFETTWTAIPSSASLTAHTVTGLTNNTAYQFKLRAVNSVGNGPESVASDPVTPSPPDLWVEDIHYQTAGLVLRHWTGGAWSWRVAGGRSSGCRNSSGPSHSAFQFLSALNLNTRYTVTAHSGHGCAAANQLDSETFTTRARGWQAPALSVANVGSASATLSIANHTGDWWYAETSGSTTCTKVDAGTGSATLSSLTPNKFYAYEAFSGSGCANSSAPLDWITEKVEFTTSGPIAATVTDLTDTSATLAVSGISSGQWSTDHVESNDPLSRYSQCLTYDYTTTSAVVTGLTAGTAYTFYVYRGGKCAFVDDRIATQAHTFQFSSGSVGSTSATLTFEHYEGAWSYQGGGASGSGGQAAGASAASSSAGQCQAVPSGTYTANLDGLTANTSYTYTAHGGGNCAGAALGQAQFTTQAASPPPAPPAAPTGLAASAGDASVTLSWSNPSDDSITGYEYNVNHNATGTGNFSGWSPWQAIDGSGAATTSHTLTDLTNGREYRFHVRAVNADGAGAQAPDASPWFVSATPQEVAEPPPPPEPEPPAAPTGLTASAGDASVTLSWSNPSDDSITGYEYNVNHNATGTGNFSGWSPWRAIGGSGADTTSHTLTGLTNGREYRFHLRAVNADGAGAAAPDAHPWFVSATPQEAAPPEPADPPGKVSSVTVTRADGVLNASWPAVDGATSYHVTYSSDNGASWSLAALHHAGTSITISGVDNALTYLVGVRARNEHGDSGWRNSPSTGPFTPEPTDSPEPADPPGKVSSVTVTRGDGTLHASWPAVPGATSYHVTYSSDNGASWSLAALHHPGTSITISGVDNALTYLVGVRARNQRGDSGWRNSPPTGPDTGKDVASIAIVDEGSGGAPTKTNLAPAFDTGASIADLSYAQGARIAPLTLPAATGGDGALSYALTPALPQGVSFDAATRALSGTPEAPLAATHYTYVANDEDRDGASLTFSLAVIADLQPEFGPGAALPDLSYEQGTFIEPLTLPAATGGDGALSYALQPALPQGMHFDKTTRVLSGTPAEQMKVARYTYTVTDADGDTAQLYFRLAATPSARALAEESVLTDGLASQGRAVLGSARRALDGRFRDADQAVDLSVLRANWSDWQDRLTAAAKGTSGTTSTATAGGSAGTWGRTSSMPPHDASGRASPEASGETGIDAAAATSGWGQTSGRLATATASGAATPGWGQTSSLSPETSGSAGDASLTPLPGVFGLSGMAGTCGTMALEETPWPDASDSRVDNGWDDGACNGAASVRLSDWLWGRRYALRLNGIFGNADDEARSGPDWTLWSAGDQRRIEGTPGNNRYETDWRSMHLGLDARFSSDWLAGVVVSRGWGETGYGYEASGISGTGKTGYGHAAQGVSGTGELSTDIWTALPYLHGRLGGFEVWGLAGGGWGEITATRSEGDGIKEDSNLNLWLGAVGASKPLLGLGAMSLSFVADAGMTHMTTDKGDGTLDGLEATTQQVRLGLAGEYEASLFDGQAELTPFWQLSGRYDGGDGLAGAGLEAQAGLRYRSERLSLVAQGHWLGMHSETGYKEYGASMEARVSPLAHGRGLTLALSPRWGADGALSGAASGMGTANSAAGIGAMWDTDIVRRAAIANTQAVNDDTAHVWSVDAEVGYGLWLPHQLGLLTPFSDMRLAGGHEQRQRLGLRLDAVGGHGLQLELSGFRASTYLETDTGVNLNATLNY